MHSLSMNGLEMYCYKDANRELDCTSTQLATPARECSNWN